MLGDVLNPLELGEDDPLMESRQAIDEYRHQWQAAIKGKLDIGRN
ncbi:MAG TPA: hypothetical protein VJX16_07570 [Terriglobales bacterium]|nr:hypothetical protein [Terriglobales bacterium]